MSDRTSIVTLSTDWPFRWTLALIRFSTRLAISRGGDQSVSMARESSDTLTDFRRTTHKLLALCALTGPLMARPAGFVPVDSTGIGIRVNALNRNESVLDSTAFGVSALDRTLVHSVIASLWWKTAYSHTRRSDDSDVRCVVQRRLVGLLARQRSCRFAMLGASTGEQGPPSQSQVMFPINSHAPPRENADTFRGSSNAVEEYRLA